jgi:hypothetical protein
VALDAGAGRRGQATLARADLTLPPQNPDAPAPEILLVRPDGIVFAASDPLPLDGTGTSLASSLTMGGTHQIAVRTPKGFGQYVVTLVTTAEGGSGDADFGQTSERTHLTTVLSPETTLKVPLLDPFGNPLAGAKVEWESGDDCGDGTFCGTGQTTTWRTSLAGVALNPVTPQTGGSPLWQARSAQQGLSKALQPIDRPGVMERVLAARHVEPVLGFVSSHGRAVGSSQLPDLATAAAIAAEARLRAEARPMAAVKGGPLCGGHSLTCSGEAEPVFRAVLLEIQGDEELVSVDVEIQNGGTPIEELDGIEILSTVGLTLEATATVRNGSGVEREISLNDPINVSVYGDQGGGISQPGRSCDHMEVAPGAFDYLVGINSAHQFQYYDELGVPCCWMPTEVVHASVVAEMEVDDGQGGASRVFREAETVVKSIPRPADPCEVRTLESGIPSFAAYPFVEVGTAYLTDACGNIVYGVGLEDSDNHDTQGDEFRIVSPVEPPVGEGVWATAQNDGNHWSYTVLLNGDVGDPGTIPDGAYTVDFEVASQSPECGSGGVITGSYTVSIADDAPQVVLWWDWDAQNSPRGPEPDDQLISPGSAVRDASGAVAMWRVPAFDGAADSPFFAGSYSNVPVKLYVAWYGSITFDPDGSPEPSYLEPCEGVDLCTGVVEKLTNAGGHLGYNSPVRTTCDTPWTTFATAGASSDPVDTPENPAGPPDTWVPVGLGVGVAKGPDQPGRYVLVAEPLDPAFRRGDAWRVMSPFLPDGFVEFEVGGGMFLDEDYRPVPDGFVVSEDTIAYLSSRQQGEISPDVYIVASDPDGQEVDRTESVPMAETGGGLYISDPITLLPPWSQAQTKDMSAVALHVAPHLGELAAFTSSVYFTGTPTKIPVAPILIGTRNASPFEVNFFHTVSSGDRVDYICLGTTCACPDPAVVCADRVDPSTINWSLDSPAPVSRLEEEPPPPGDPLPAVYVRGIRGSTGRTASGTVELNAAWGTDSASLNLEILKPDDLSCCHTNACSKAGFTIGCEVEYFTDVHDLSALVIDAADEYGVPPQILMAQAFREAVVRDRPSQPDIVELNTFSTRYELDKDFQYWTGDGSTAAHSAGRKMFDTFLAGPNLGINPTSGEEEEIEYMPCETSPGTPCSPDDTPNPRQAFELLPSSPPPAVEWQLWWPPPGAVPLPDARLDVEIMDPVAGLTYTNVYRYDADHSSGPTQPSEFEVIGTSGTVTFGAPVADASPFVVTAVRAVPNLKLRSLVTNWGVSITDPEALMQLIHEQNATDRQLVILPPLDPYTTILQWANTPGLPSPIASNQTITKYSKTFEDELYFRLVRIDNSFDVQGQWFMACSYGLLQQLPEGLRNVLTMVPEPLLTTLTTLYNPKTHSPQVLFDPSKSVEFAAVWDGAIVPLDEELIDPVSGEPDCTPYVNGSPNACTWERYWKRVLRMYHAGSEFNFDGYDDAVWALTPQFEPVEVTP